MTSRLATAIGFGAVLMWALLALLTVGSAPVPPLQLNAMCFTLATVLGLVWAARTGQMQVIWRVRPSVLAFGSLGLFGYHALYFSALRLAPPALAGLIAYLWPLLIVLMSALLPGERLRAGHILGALLGFAGAALVIIGSTGGMVETAPNAMLGYLLACACALTWAGYSVGARRMGDVPTVAVAAFCAVSACLSWAVHFALETTIWPQDGLTWLSVAGLGAGPVGLAFFLWDIGVKKGDIQMLGTAAYAAPLLSTLALVTAGIAALTPQLGLAAILITSGAALAAWASATQPRSKILKE